MKWVLTIVGGIIGVLVLLGGLGYYFLSKPIDPNSQMGQDYAKGFKAFSWKTASARQVARPRTRRCSRRLDEVMQTCMQNAGLQ